MLHRERYLPAAGEDRAQWMSVCYIDAGLTRLERFQTSGASDEYHGFEQRTSPDNGRTWTERQELSGIVQQLDGGGIVSYPAGIFIDRPRSRRYQMRMRRIWPGMPVYTFHWGSHRHPYNDHVFAAVDDGPETLLRYEQGPDFDPDNPFDPDFCSTNRAYLGQSISFAPDGTAYLPLVAHAGSPESPHTSGGLVVMRRDPTASVWQASNIEYLGPERSSRGVLEPEVAVLRDGRLLTIVRGSNTATTPGRKWFSVSDDGGRRISPLQELRYDDGSRFYSPSSLHRFIRSARNGTLYWMANITPEPPDGNSPRYPLYIAEIDEDRLAVRRDSLLLVDDRATNEPAELQISNFNVLEDRETLEIEIYLTRIGEVADHFWQGAVYRYTFSPPA